jgi:hypothetical protein
MQTDMVVKKYLFEFGGSMFLYCLAVFASVSLLNHYGHMMGLFRYPIALIPILPVLLCLVSILRFFNAADELQQLIQTKAVASAFVISGFIFITAGFLENAGIPEMKIIFAFPIMISLWGICYGYFNWRYGIRGH